jgi:perosamine synthetase
MKFLTIPRGQLSHSISEDFLSLLRVSIAGLENHDDVRDFESKFAEYMEVKECVAFPLARTGIYAALKSQNFQKGASIIMPPLTIKGILDVVLSLGLNPIFVDLNLEDANFSLSKLKEALDVHRPKAIIITYLFGVIPNVEEYIELLRSRQVFIIEDFSQAINGKYKGKKVGTFGDCGVFSASSIKTLDTYSGGLVITNDQSLFKELKSFQSDLKKPNRKHLAKIIWKNLLRNVGTNRLVFDFLTFPCIVIASKIGFKGVIRFSGNRPQFPISELPDWWFFSYSSFQAKFALKQLYKITSADERRIDNFNKINSGNPIHHLSGSKQGESVYWQNILLVSNGTNFMAYLRKRGIDSALSSLILISKLEKYGIDSDTPNAKHFYENGVYTPCYPSLTKSDISRLSKGYKQFL